MLLNDVT